MSTKKLSRTAIEGGRTNKTKIDHRDSTRCERRAVRLLIAGAHGDAERLGDLAPPPREPIRADHADKLAPVLRWLYAHVGFTEDALETAVHRAFERRTVKGRHLVHDHLVRRERGWRGGYPASQTKIVMLPSPGAPRLYRDKSPFRMSLVDGVATVVNERVGDEPGTPGTRRETRKSRAKARKAAVAARRQAKMADAARTEAEIAQALVERHGRSQRAVKRAHKRSTARIARLDAAQTLG